MEEAGKTEAVPDRKRLLHGDRRDPVSLAHFQHALNVHLVGSSIGRAFVLAL